MIEYIFIAYGYVGFIVYLETNDLKFSLFWLFRIVKELSDFLEND